MNFPLLLKALVGILGLTTILWFRPRTRRVPTPEARTHELLRSSALTTQEKQGFATLLTGRQTSLRELSLHSGETICSGHAWIRPRRSASIGVGEPAGEC